MAKYDKLSIFISLVLRHKPQSANIQLDCNGYANVEELIKGVSATGRTITKDILDKIVMTDSKGRYSYDSTGTKIRANQGHSIVVESGLIKVDPPEYLYHGTSENNVGSIMSKGLLKRNRLYVHLTDDKEMALRVGKRHGRPVILKVNSKEMLSKGYNFYVSTNGVWQIDFVPPEFITLL